MNLESLFGKKIKTEDLLLAGVIFLLLTQRHQEEETTPAKKSEGLFGLGGIKDILAKLGDNDMLLMMLIYMLL